MIRAQNLVKKFGEFTAVKIGMTVLFSSIFNGIALLWDRQFGFLKETLVLRCQESPSWPAECWIDSTSMDSIAEASGVSKATITSIGAIRKRYAWRRLRGCTKRMSSPP